MLDLIVYCVSVRPAMYKMRKIHYRMIRASVKTEEDMKDMYSSEDELSDAHEEEEVRKESLKN